MEMQGETHANKLAEILNLCESDPDAGLAFIAETIQRNPGAASDPFAYFGRAMAFGSKGLFGLARGKPDMDFLAFDEQELRDGLGVADMHLDLLEKGLHEIAEMESLGPRAVEAFLSGMGQKKVDAMALVLERCRPGRVQEILGKTKLLYFGPHRVSHRNECEITRQEFEVFRDTFFACDRIAKSALISLDGRDSKGRRYVSVALYINPSIFDERGEQSAVAGFVCLYNDRTYSPGSLPPSTFPLPGQAISAREQKPAREEPKKGGFFKRLFR